jgi:RimJ/RimL family protein N-acetyltransferase
MVISTPRLFVRYLTGPDYDAFSNLESDPNVKKFTGAVATIARDRYNRFVSVPSQACMAVCRKDTACFIGRCGFRLDGDRVDLEIFLGSEAQGQGFGPELFDAMIGYCPSAFPGLKVTASVSPANSRAVRLLGSRGFADSGESILLKSGLEHSVYVRTI